MTVTALLQIIILAVLILVLTPLLGRYMARVFEGERVFLSPIVRPLERGIYRLAGVSERRQMDWKRYLVAFVLFSIAGMLITYLLLRIQDQLPLNPDHQTAVPPFLAFNTTISFHTTTNWQNYGGETTMSYLSQVLSLGASNFMAGGAGLALGVAVIRGFVRRSGSTIGNFWVDLTRSLLYVLIPLSLLGALVFVAQGTPQTLSGAVSAKTLDGAIQTISRGPVASFEVISLLGTNGGGFLNANSAHPFENPTPLTNLFSLLILMIIPFGLTYTFGIMAGNVRQGWMLFAVMAIINLVAIGIAAPAEQAGNPAFARLGISQTVNGSSPGGNMEGKEVRFGPAVTGFFNAGSNGTADGRAGGALDSMTPLGGMMPMLLILMGSVAPGGDGSGLYGMLIYAILAVFTAGLMVGRTPEYLGKKIQSYEIKMAALAILVGPLAILCLSALSWVISPGTSALLNSGPHGLSELIYAFGSVNANVGSAFSGLGSNTNYYNVALALGMFVGRFLFVIPILALAGSLVRKPRVEANAGTFPTDTVLFGAWLMGVLLVVGALTFFPALSLGPVVEHLRMTAGRLT